MSGSEGEPRREKRPVVQVTMNVPFPVWRAWTILAHKRGVSMTELNRQAISTEFYIERALTRMDQDPEAGQEQILEMLFDPDKRNVLTDDVVTEGQEEFGLGDFDIGDIIDLDNNPKE